MIRNIVRVIHVFPFIQFYVTHFVLEESTKNDTKILTADLK